MRAIIVKFNDSIQAVSVVNEDDADRVKEALLRQAQLSENPEAWVISQYAVDPAQTVIDYCIR